MPRYFTHYWSNSTWRTEIDRNAQGKLLDHIAGELFLERDVKVGDIVYVVTIMQGLLLICGKLKVAMICGVDEAAAYLNCAPDDLWQATEHVVPSESTPMAFDCTVPLDVVRRLRFISSTGRSELKFKNNSDKLDGQTLRPVRELDPTSAAELDALLPQLEDFPNTGTNHATSDESIFPDEVDNAQTYYEGATKTITVNVYERDVKARRACIDHYGASCSVCSVNFKEVYGDIGEGFIHVHHLIPLSEIRQGYQLDPITDLRPVCPNCHAMLHRKKPEPYTIDELKEMLKGR